MNCFSFPDWFYEIHHCLGYFDIAILDSEAVHVISREVVMSKEIEYVKPHSTEVECFQPS